MILITIRILGIITLLHRICIIMILQLRDVDYSSSACSSSSLCVCVCVCRLRMFLRRRFIIGVCVLAF